MTFNIPLIATTCGEILLVVSVLFVLVPLVSLFIQDPDVLAKLCERMGR